MKEKKGKKKKKKTKGKDKDINITQRLFKSRDLYLYEALNGDDDERVAQRLVRQLRALDKSPYKPIRLHINCPGGSVPDGFAIIDTINSLKSPVYTIIEGEACSMAGIISVCGKKRYITKYGIWMAHDMAGGVYGEDYTTKTIARVKFLEQYCKLTKNFLKEYTKLTDKDIEKATNKELWFFPDECLEKGIVDKVI